MPRSSNLSVLVLLSAATATLASLEVSAQADRPIRTERGQITGVKLGAGAWYAPANHAFRLDVAGGGRRCGSQSLWVRAEDGNKTTVPLSAAELPAELGTIFPGAFGLGPGTYDVTVDGTPLTTNLGTFEACAGSAKLGPVVVDETVLGQSYPKIIDAKWEGASQESGRMGLYKIGGPDEVLDVTVANYLSSSTWTTPSSLNQGAVCGVSVITSRTSGADGTWPDPFPLVLPNAQGGTSVYHGQILTPGPYGAIFKANVTASLAKFEPIVSGTSYFVTVKSTPFNNSVGAYPCIGAVTMMFKAE